MLPAASERILTLVGDDELVLDVGGWAAPFNRADWVLDLMPFATRGPSGHHGPAWERFGAKSWTQRDACARTPWPWPDDHFAFATCSGTLQELRDPLWACRELSRVARAGYVEVPTTESELVHDVQGAWAGREEHRWLCEFRAGELVFTHKLHSVHSDSSLRVQARWAERLAPEELVQGFFWDGELRARERFLAGEERDAFKEELRRRLQDRFEPSTTELRARQARDVARQGVRFAGRPAKHAADRVLDELTRRRER